MTEHSNLQQKFKARQPFRRRHGQRHTPEWIAWKAARQRCENPNNKDFAHYGARGVRVCARWKYGSGELSGFQCFIADMGKRPTPQHSIDRRDNDGDYTPRNCHWATKREQARNRRGVKLDPAKVRNIKRSNEPDKVLAERYGVVPGAIWNARNGLTWREVRI